MEDEPAGRLSTETLEERRARLGADRAVTPSSAVRMAPRLASGVLVAGGILILLFAIVTVTGLPAPEPWTRYPLADLQRVADEINRQSEAMAPRRSAQIGLSPTAPRRPASVDWLRGRVQIDEWMYCGVGLDSAEDWDMVVPGYRIDSTGCDDFG